MRLSLQLFIATISLLISLFPVPSLASGLYSVSISPDELVQHLQGGRRITSYTVKVNGVVYGVNKIPEDWWVEIRPAIEEHQVKAAAGHGSSWIGIDDVKRGVFDNFLTVMQLGKYGEIKVSIDITIDIPTQEKEVHFTVMEKSVRMQKLR